MWRINSNAETLIDVATDNHSVKRSQLRAGWQASAASYYARAATPQNLSVGQTVQLIRSDVDVI